ncbi:MAG: cobalamin-binding protein [Desulfobacteraceae bacterium]|nr:cobalamin-binding protein [Desulfobacteraceae bacterium]
MVCLFTLVLAFVLCAGKSGESREIRDQAGRTVSVPDNPERVVSLAPSVTEIVFALGEGDRLKGVTEHCDFPAAALALPKIGSYVHLDLEKIVALKPDLCIGVRDGNPPNVAAKLQSLGIPVYAVDPRNLGTIVNTVLEIGRILGATQRAESLAKEMIQRIEQVKDRLAGTEQRPRVFFQIGIVPLVSAGGNTIIHELITTAGGINLAVGPTPYPRFSKEKVLALQPDVIIITSMTRGQDLEQVKADWEQYDSLPAVRSKRIAIVDANLFDRPTPRIVEGLETLAEIIHPDLF